MSKGSRRRSSRGRVTPDVEVAQDQGGGRRVWFVASDSGIADQELLVRAARKACAERGWLFGVRRSSAERILGGDEKDRPYRLLRGRDAWDLYRSFHFSTCLVLASHTAFVKSDPSQSPATLRELVPLSEFVDHKALYQLARGEEEVREAVSGLEVWPSADCCQGERDPRALPLHVFDPTMPWPSLRSDEGRRSFERRYAYRGASRRDFADRVWENPAALHGTPDGSGDPLVVAGRALTTGYHWDVQRERGKERVTTTHEVWLVESGGYLNIYPNGYIRTGALGRRVWEEKR